MLINAQIFAHQIIPLVKNSLQRLGVNSALLHQLLFHHPDDFLPLCQRVFIEGLEIGTTPLHLIIGRPWRSFPEGWSVIGRSNTGADSALETVLRKRRHWRGARC